MADGSDYSPIFQQVLAAHASGLAIVPVWPLREDGSCRCGKATCTNAGKHPRVEGWSTRNYDKAELYDYNDKGWFATGYGVRARDGLLVIDIDARHGGTESARRLLQAFPELGSAGFKIASGSGSGSEHWYFRLAEEKRLHTKLRDYPGIDFMSSGFLVGPGSLHKSGGSYAVLSGGWRDLAPPPSKLLLLLEKAENPPDEANDKYPPPSIKDLHSMLESIEDYDEYEDWIRVGMAVHNATAGSPTGLRLWSTWSRQSKKFDPDVMRAKWNSFAGTEVGVGTLVWMAERNGWKWPEVENYPRPGGPEGRRSDDDPDWEPLNPLPEPLGAAAYIGILGQIVDLLAPTSEAGRENIALSVLAVASAADAYYRKVELAAGQRLNNFAALIGDTSSRKGTGMGLIQQMLSFGSGEGAPRILHSLDSGEGVIFVVRDEKRTQGKRDRNGEFTADADDAGMVVDDPGVPDKRVLFVTTELERVFGNMLRSGASLSAIVREAWDNTPLQNNSRNSGRGGDRCNRPHISLLAHTTPYAMKQMMGDDLHSQNGLANRFLFVRTERNGALPFPRIWNRNSGNRDAKDEQWEALAYQLSVTLAAAPYERGNMDFDMSQREDFYISASDRAKARWSEWYIDFTTNNGRVPREVEAYIQRLPSHVARIAGVYAMLDKSLVVELEHLEAALAWVEHGRQVAVWLFGKPVLHKLSARAKKLLATLQERPDGLSRGEITKNVFANNVYGDSLGKVIEELEQACGLVLETRRTRGKSAQVYRLPRRT